MPVFSPRHLKWPHKAGSTHCTWPLTITAHNPLNKSRTISTQCSQTIQIQSMPLSESGLEWLFGWSGSLKFHPDARRTRVDPCAWSAYMIPRTWCTRQTAHIPDDCTASVVVVDHLLLHTHTKLSGVRACRHACLLWYTWNAAQPILHRWFRHR